MDIMAAGMHCLSLGCKWQACLFLNWKCVHIRPKEDCFPPSGIPDIGNNSASNILGLYSQVCQFFLNKLHRHWQLHEKFRIFMELSSVLDQLILELFCHFCYFP